MTSQNSNIFKNSFIWVDIVQYKDDKNSAGSAKGYP